MSHAGRAAGGCAVAGGLDQAGRGGLYSGERARRVRRLRQLCCAHGMRGAHPWIVL